MVQSLTEPHADAAQATLRADRELDRVAWNLPPDPVSAAHGTYRDGLDWAGFRDLYYPESRRHNFAAIVAYGDYKSTSISGPQPAGEAAGTKGDATSAESLSLQDWEDEGGMSG
jgi:hypothetical protein